MAVFPRDPWGNKRTEYAITALILGVCFSVALPICLDLFGIALTRTNIQWGTLLVVLIPAELVVRRLVLRIPAFPNPVPADLKELYIVGVFHLFLIVTRVLQIHDVFVPNWMDGLLHTQLLEKIEMSRKIGIERIYHVGFHSSVLFLHYWFGWSLSQAVLLLGQWLSAVSGLTLYLLARRYTRSVYFSLVSTVVYSLFLLFPSFLVSWGRYPFLLGLTILPLAILKSRDWVSGGRTGFLPSLFLAGTLALAHYGAFLAWLSFIVTHFLHRWVVSSDRKGNWMLTGRSLLLFIPLVVPGIPKIANLLAHPDTLASMTSNAARVSFADDVTSVLILAVSHDYFLGSFIAAGIWFSSIWKKRPFHLLLSWPAFTLAMILAQYLFLGLSISNFSNWIVLLSVPISILCGLTVKYLYSFERSLPDPGSPSALAWTAGLLLSFAFLGAWRNASSIDPKTVLFSREDSAAMQWIAENTPKDSVFWIESFFWGDQLMPSDGGGWIHLLTGRETVYPREVGELYDMCVYVKDHSVDYLYLQDTLDEDNFGLRLSDFSGTYELVYSNDPVMIVSVQCP